MLLSLPPSLLALVFAVLEGQAVAGPSPSPSPTVHFGNVGDYVAHGLGIDNGSTTASPTKSNNDAPSLATTGTGQEYASKCADALKTWSKSSFAWQWDHDIVSTSTFSSAFTETMVSPGTTKVTSVITLCDGHPRVVGHTSVSNGKKYTSTVAWTNTITNSAPNHAYPTPSPCSIQPSDCKTLSNSYEKWLSKELADKGFATGEGPMCTVTPSSTMSYSTNHLGRDCDNCMIAAHTARVMFWPITTAAGGNLCNNTGLTITSSPTGPPNSFVTEGITITSPTVAVSLGYMSRVDGCGTTINHTIIPVRPEEVTSVRGFRALFSHHRFNFADLNYFCMDSNTTNSTIADGLGDSCYQQVPADAYFGGLNNAVVLDQAPFRNMTKEQMTIWDDYQPQLLPPQTMTKAITSLWGEDCIIHPDGVWDPPIALTPQASLVVPTRPGGGSATEKDEPEKTPATPINSYGPVPPRETGIKKPERPPTDGETSQKQHFTALPDTTTGPSSGGDDGDKPNDDASSHDTNSGSYGGSGSPNDQDGHGSGDDAGSGDGNDQGDEAGNDSDHNAGNGNGNDQADKAGNGDASNPGKITSINVHTTIITVGSKVLQCTQDSNGAWIIPDASTTHAASPGGSAVEIDAVTLTAGSNGLSTVAADNVLTIGNKVMTCAQNSDGAWIIPDASTTHTASKGGSAIEVDGVTLTAASGGLVTMHASKTGGSSEGSDESDGHASQTGKSSDASDGSDSHASKTGGSSEASDKPEESDSSSDEDTTNGSGPSQTNRVQFTSATDSQAASSATSSDTSGAGAISWPSLKLAIGAVAICFLAL